MENFDSKCFSCNKCNLSTDFRSSNYNGSREKVMCDSYGWVSPFDSCRNYSNAHRPQSYLNECYDAFVKKCRWYVLTAISRILNFSEEIDNLFITMKDDLYHSTDGQFEIVEYDFNGKMVAEKLLEDYNNPETRDRAVAYAKTIYENCLVIVLELIKSGNIKAAEEYYFDVISMMMDHYGIEAKPIVADVNDDKVIGRKIF